MFLDLSIYLRSLPVYSNPQFLYQDLYDTVEKLIVAKEVVDKMLQKQAGY
jgi:hypothetical protein